MFSKCGKTFGKVYSTQTVPNIEQLQVDWYELSISCPVDENKFSFTSNSSFRKKHKFISRKQTKTPMSYRGEDYMFNFQDIDNNKDGTAKGY